MVKPLADYIFLKFNEKKKDEGGIVLSDVSKDKQAVATVAAIGPDVKDLKIGDEVIFNPFLPREIKVKGEKFFILKHKDIYAKN